MDIVVYYRRMLVTSMMQPVHRDIFAEKNEPLPKGAALSLECGKRILDM
jgi:hypothetical protein